MKSSISRMVLVAGLGVAGTGPQVHAGEPYTFPTQDSLQMQGETSQIRDTVSARMDDILEEPVVLEMDLGKFMDMTIPLSEKEASTPMFGHVLFIDPAHPNSGKLVSMDVTPKDFGDLKIGLYPKSAGGLVTLYITHEIDKIPATDDFWDVAFNSSQK